MWNNYEEQLKIYKDIWDKDINNKRYQRALERLKYRKQYSTGQSECFKNIVPLLTLEVDKTYYNRYGKRVTIVRSIIAYTSVIIDDGTQIFIDDQEVVYYSNGNSVYRSVYFDLIKEG